MKRAIMCVVFFLAVSAALAQNKDAVLGVWQNSTGEARIQIFRQGNVYWGKIVWLKEPSTNGKPKLDVKNPDESLRSRPILGLVLLNGFAFKGGKEWGDGKIYDPKSGNDYSCKMTLQGPDVLNMRGYMGISLLGRTEIWTRVK